MIDLLFGKSEEAHDVGGQLERLEWVKISRV